MCFELNELKRAFFFFLVVLNEVMLNWASEENTLHLSEVAQSSSRRLSSSTSFSIPHPSFRLMCTHRHAVAENTHTNTLSKASPEPKLNAICRSIFYSSITCNQQKKHTRVFLHMNLQNTLSCGHFS